MMQVTLRSVVMAFLMSVAACGSDKPAPPTPVAKRELPQPVVEMVAPTAIAAGDKVTIIGRGFADKSIGEPRLTFSGVYQTTSGRVEQVAFQVTPEFRNQGMLEWTFGPNIPFSPANETGIFRGVVKVTNVGREGGVKDASPLNVQLDVRPSIIVRQFRPVNAGCSVGLKSSTAETPFFLEVEAVGLREGTPMAPLRYAFTVMKEHFQFEGFFGDTFGFDPEELFPKSGPITVVSDVVNGRVARIGTGVPTDVGVFKGAMNGAGIGNLPNQFDDMFKLTQFKTAPMVSDASDSFQASVIISVRDSAGTTVSRVLPLTVFAPIEIRYDGSQDKVVQSYDPVPVSGCMDGGYIGRDVVYTELHAEARARSFKFKASGSAAVNVGVAKLEGAFGIEVEGLVSSTDQQNLSIGGLILPNEYGVFYRQTLKLKKVGTIVSHGPCGNSQDLGTVEVTDWVWSPDLAKGWSCPPLPKSNLKPGEIFDVE